MNSVLKKIFCFFILVAVVGGGIWFHQKNKITFSVVIPVYNAEKYLEKCLDSIFIQKGEFEVIAVNDGSKDKSLEILQKYAKKYPNMRVIDQENQGISAARNRGMKEAKNKYVTFIDNDDWWEPGAFATVMEVIKKDKPDILLSSFYDVYDRQWVKDTRGEEAAKFAPEESKFPKHDMDKLVLFSPFYAKEALGDLYYSGTWVVHSFFSKDFLVKHDLVFPSKVDVAEDLIFLFRAYAYNPRVSIIDAPIYNYYNRVSSASKGLSTLDILSSRMEYMRQTEEYKSALRRVQMWIDDSFVGVVFLCIANLRRHNRSLDEGIDKIYAIYNSMSQYNENELQSARNYQKLRSILTGDVR